MSGVLNWLKSNILIVVFCVLIVALPPAGFVGSSMWNASIKKAAEEKLSTNKRKVDAVSKVRYALPPITPDEQPYEDSKPPNAALTAYFATQRAERQKMIEDVVTRAVRFNKKDDRSVLLTGVFPGLDDDREERRRVKEMAGLIVGDDETPSVYDGLFRSINAGEPMKPEDVARRVVDAYRAEIDRAGGDDRAMSEEDRDALLERMKSQRLGVYARRAEELSVFGSKEALYGSGSSGMAASSSSTIIQEVPSGPDVTDAFVWQMDYWFIEDLLRAVQLANTTEDGLATEVPRSPVKRIVSISLDKLEFPEAAAGSAGSDDEPSGRAASGPPTRNPMGMPSGMRAPTASRGPSGAPAGPAEASYTGRAPDEKNGVYQIRRGTITVIAASDKLVRFFDALSKANLLTVIGVELSDVDVWADLDEGYYYGPDSVVRAEIEVESVWLDFWLADLVPDRVAAAWGIERPAPEAAEQP
ncbi:MAG: hypothetical protein H6810_10865 [Phycisphaeraceae bacterium]|nr:MAG: hypothetical protein H6810_10865 [Phycisphaeraceae bacterium]